MTRAGIAGSVLAVATLDPTKAMAAALGRVSEEIGDGQRHTLRGLWDAVIPGTWEGFVEDALENGDPAPGADDAKVEDWIEQVAGTLPWPLDWLSDVFLGLWADDLDLWADVVHFPPFDGRPKFWELPLGPSALERGRQRKVILMQALFGALVDLQYQAGIMISKAAFYCDFWYEANDPQTRVGREYIGFPLPPGTTPYQDFSYDRVLGDHDDWLVVVNPSRGLIGPP